MHGEDKLTCGNAWWSRYGLWEVDSRCSGKQVQQSSSLGVENSQRWVAGELMNEQTWAGGGVFGYALTA